MGSSSVSIYRGPVHWQGLLFVVSLFNFWSQPTTAQVTVESTDALEGTDVILRIRHNTCNAAYFLWYKGTSIDIYKNIEHILVKPESYIRGPPGGKGIVNHDGSLVLKNVTRKDSGIYTVLVQLQGCQKMIACGLLTVYSRVIVPTLRASKTTVTEAGDAVVMTCNTNHDSIEWFFEGKSLRVTKRRSLSLDLKTLTIDPVLKRDAGNYQCKASNPRSSGKSAPLKLDVKFG